MRNRYVQAPYLSPGFSDWGCSPRSLSCSRKAIDIQSNFIEAENQARILFCKIQ
ncbi:MAG: hypothetical protein C5S48_03935 [Candidatus Methanogaster sp.]|nr:MAG: hypothetical protein C5S48_03935 [ANME-2 cluster archaeon]